LSSLLNARQAALPDVVFRQSRDVETILEAAGSQRRSPTKIAALVRRTRTWRIAARAARGNPGPRVSAPFADHQRAANTKAGAAERRARSTAPSVGDHRTRRPSCCHKRPYGEQLDDVDLEVGRDRASAPSLRRSQGLALSLVRGTVAAVRGTAATSGSGAVDAADRKAPPFLA